MSDGKKTYKERIEEWLDKGEGGEWYEPYVTNRDKVMLTIYTIIWSLIIIAGCVIIKYY